ncbi:sulfite exporter TauE/SafE family protein [Mesorhizobium sp. B2-6-2]|uniref:HoxN/HupN/NixA family nickel/cobalt transporter n=1 Tax=Mesorhizobium sp. B2-6-2 TaxID=2589915 RepID=UPI00112BED72|nr:sulfite exporter TauE/SafE family protein [Mesorhizobium sp. B2-6-2]TPJ77145.1 nickel/cobalt efflux protein RcnA [Mesorhizobium sp. B2-6-2]
MTDFSQLLQQGATNAWLFIPSAILLGALHGLEPGHSKTMMAAFIIAVRGTVWQAFLLAIAATVSHTAIVWLVALAGIWYGPSFSAEATEPYFLLASGVLIVGVALWMLLRTYREQQDTKARLAYQQKAQSNQTRVIDTGHGLVDLMLVNEGGSNRFRAKFKNMRGVDKKPPAAKELILDTKRDDGSKQTFRFLTKGDYLETIDAVPGPLSFDIVLTWDHDDHEHVYYESFRPHGAAKPAAAGQLDLGDMEAMDAHARSHAMDIQKRFAGRTVTTGQVIMFGLTGGLLPCPAAITVLVLCLQLKQFSLGLTLVLCFSIGLALTLLFSGTVAAWGMQKASKKWKGFDAFADRVPYFSSAVIIAVGLFTAYSGYSHLLQGHAA